ncbi:MAG TPA: M23 family metallopeptidase [bacterium]|nr:M23 family metallopeptidase [bacterium]
MKLLFLQDDSGIKEFSFTKRKVLLTLIVALVLGGGFFYLALDAVTGTIYQVKLTHVKDNNARLVSLLNTLQTRIDTLENHIMYLQNQDEAIRAYAGLRDVDEDVRNLGIGGTRYDKTSDLDYLIPDDQVKVSSVLFDVDQIARKVKLQRLISEELYQSIRIHSEEIGSTPSVIPINSGYLTDGFGWRRDPFNRQRRFHYGQDISARRGTPVHATADGVVRYAKRRGGFGLVVALDHGYGYETLYAHLSSMEVEPGDTIERGQKIGEVGNTGRSTAPHLHYEVHVDNIPMNPRDYFFLSYLD